MCVPGHDERKLARCRDFGADIILFDLEDSVPASAKARAAELIAAHARPGDAVRLCGGDPEQVRADAALVDSLPGVTPWLPKVMDVWSAIYASRNLGRPVVPVVEHPGAVLTIAAALVYSDDFLSPPPGLAGIAFGAADFCAAAGVRPRSPLVDRAQETVVLAARALGVPAYDSPCEFRDGRDVAMEARRAVNLGFTGKGCVFPEHVAAVREIFRPAPRDLERARRIAARAEERGGELFEDEGQVVAPPHLLAARELLDG